MQFGSMLSLRLSDADRARLDALAERAPGTAAALARHFVVMGLDAVEKDPANLVVPAGVPAASCA